MLVGACMTPAFPPYVRRNFQDHHFAFQIVHPSLKCLQRKGYKRNDVEL